MPPNLPMDGVPYRFPDWLYFALLGAAVIARLAMHRFIQKRKQETSKQNDTHLH